VNADDEPATIPIDEPSRPRQRLGLIVRLLVSAGILAWLATRIDVRHVASAFRGLRWEWWAGAVGLYIICQFLCCIRWKMLSRPLGFTEPLGRLTNIYFVGMFFNLFLPTSVGGDAVKAVYLARGSGRKLSAVASVLIDRASGLFALLLIACAAVAASPVELPANFRAAVWSLGAAAVLGVFLLPFAATFQNLVRLPTRLDLLVDQLVGAIGLYSREPSALAVTTGLSLLVQGLNAVLVAMLGLSLSLDVPMVYYGIAAPMVTLLTLIPVSLNGMGLREGGMTLFLAPAGVAAADAVTLALLWFCVQTATSLIGGAIYLVGRLGAAEELSHERAIVDHRAGEGRTGEHRAAA
jgi:uncharacterized membrane protein YbhN (UPF0104 family)